MLEVLALWALAAASPPPPTPIEARIAARLRSFAGRIGKDQLVTLTDEVKVGGSGVLHSLRSPVQTSVLSESRALYQ